MKSILRLLFAVPSLLCASGLWVATLDSYGPVYTVTTVRAGLTHDPQDWVGRTILVRGRVGGCSLELDAVSWPCRHPTDRTPLPVDTLEALPLVLDDADAVLSFARRIPVLSSMLPGPQVLHWESLYTYRVRLRAGSFPFCGIGTCYEALLLNASPGLQ